METSPQVITARFMYGPLDMVSLSGEKVCVMTTTTTPGGLGGDDEDNFNSADVDDNYEDDGDD